MNGMMVIVMIKVTHEPKAPRTPNFLFQKPKNKSAPNNHSETPQKPAGSLNAENRVHPGDQRTIFEKRDQILGFVRKPFLVSKEEVDDDHRCANQVVVEIFFEDTEPD